MKCTSFKLHDTKGWFYKCAICDKINPALDAESGIDTTISIMVGNRLIALICKERYCIEQSIKRIEYNIGRLPECDSQGYLAP